MPCAPQLRYDTVKPGNVQGRNRMGVVEGSCGSVFGESSFYRETWGARRGCRHVAKRNSVARSQSSDTGPIASCGYCCPFCSNGGRYPASPVGTRPAGSVFGDNSFYRETWGTRREGSPCG